MKYILSLLAICTFTLVPLPAQQRGTQLVFAFVGLRSVDDTITTTQIRVLENRLTTVLVRIAEQQGYSLIIPRNRERILGAVYEGADPDTPLSRMVTAHGLVLGEINLMQSRYFLDLQLIRTESGETIFAFSREFDSYDQALDGTEPALFGLFGVPVPEGERVAGPGPAVSNDVVQRDSRDWPIPDRQDERYSTSPTLSRIAGSWRTESGFDTAEINENGTGRIRILDSEYMRIRVAVENGLVVVRQDEPNSPKLYLGSVPYSIAVQVVPMARPMRWLFRLNEAQDRLSGVKETTYLYIEDGRIVRADNSYSRAAEWSRLD